MIVAIEGEVALKEPTFIHLKTHGITYHIFVSLNCASKIDTKEVSLNISQIIREDSNTLYGFMDTNEKIMFDRLVKINGVGPSTAMAICSTFTPSAFSRAIAAQDVDSIKMVPGIGPKSAKRILVELGDFSLEISEKGKDRFWHDAMAALETLGFKKDKIQKVFSTCISTDTSALVKEALKKLNT